MEHTSYNVQHRTLSVFKLCYRRSRRRFVGPWVGPINAALNVSSFLRSPQVQSQSFPPLVALSLCRSSGTYFSSVTHATINLQPPSYTVLYRTPRSIAAVLQFPVMSNIRRSSVRQSVHPFSLLPGPRRPAFSSSVDMALLDNVWSPMRNRVPDYNNFLVRTVASILSHPVRLRRLCRKGCCPCSATCTGLLGFEVASYDMQYEANRRGPLSGVRVAHP